MRHVFCVLAAVSVSSFVSGTLCAQDVKRDIKGVFLGMSEEEARAAASKFLSCIPSSSFEVYCKRSDGDVNERLEFLLTPKPPRQVMAISYNFCTDGNFDAVFRDLMNDFHGMSEDDAPNKSSKTFFMDDKISAQVQSSGICISNHSTPRATPTYSITLKDQELVNEAAEFLKRPTEGRVAPKL